VIAYRVLSVQPSNRVLTTMFGTAVGATPFLTGAGVKAGTGAAKALFRAGKEDVSLEGDEPWFDKSEIGGDASPEEARRNPDI